MNRTAYAHVIIEDMNGFQVADDLVPLSLVNETRPRSVTVFIVHAPNNPQFFWRVRIERGP